MSITKTRKLKRTSQLDTLARASGSCYSKVISLVRKTKQHKGFWLSKWFTREQYLRQKIVE